MLPNQIVKELSIEFIEDYAIIINQEMSLKRVSLSCSFSFIIINATDGFIDLVLQGIFINDFLVSIAKH